jgi:hypothetical protein
VTDARQEALKEDDKAADTVNNAEAQGAYNVAMAKG